MADRWTVNGRGPPLRGTSRWKACWLAMVVLATSHALLAGTGEAATPVRIMPLGDSITDGGTEVSYRVGLENRLRAGGYSFDFVGSQSGGPPSLIDREHEGHPSFTIDGIAAGVVGWLQAAAPDITLLMIGTNDMGSDASASTAPQRLSSLLDTMTSTRPSMRILVASIPPRTDPTANQRVNGFNATLPGIVNSKVSQGRLVSFVDINAVLTVSDLADGVHPNGAGYDKMAAAWYGALQPFLPAPTTSLTASPGSVSAGSAVTATWSGIPNPTTTNWIGLYAPGAGDGALLAWRYLTGAAAGSVPLTIPAGTASGTYELRLFGSGFGRLAVSNTFTVGGDGGPSTTTPGVTTTVPSGGATLSASPGSVSAGSAVTATWSGIPNPAATNWIGLYAPGAADGNYLAWRYLTGAASGSVPFTIPAATAAGTYELRLFGSGFGRLAVSNSFTVGGGGSSSTTTSTTVPPSGGATLSASPGSVSAGSAVTATWSGIPNPAATNWIGLYAPGAADGNYLAWQYLTGAASGSVPFTIPAATAAGTYELRLFGSGFGRLAVSNSFTVGGGGSSTTTSTTTTVPGGGPTVSASPGSVPNGGTGTATWSGIPGPTATNWIGLYAAGAADTSLLAWRYLTGAASGSVPFTIPSGTAAGTYELRLFSSGFSRLAVGNAFTVT